MHLLTVHKIELSYRVSLTPQAKYVFSVFRDPFEVPYKTASYKCVCVCVRVYSTM